MYHKNQVPIHLKPDSEPTEKSVRRWQVYLYYLYIRADIHHYSLRFGGCDDCSNDVPSLKLKLRNST